MQINSELLNLGQLDKRLPVSQKMQVSMAITIDEMSSLQKAFCEGNIEAPTNRSSLIERPSHSLQPEIVI